MGSPEGIGSPEGCAHKGLVSMVGCLGNTFRKGSKEPLAENRKNTQLNLHFLWVLGCRGALTQPPSLPWMNKSTKT